MTTPWTPPGEELPSPHRRPARRHRCRSTRPDLRRSRATLPTPPVLDPSARRQRSAEACDPAFKAFVGKALGRSELAYWVYYPTKRAWDALADHRITCVVGFPDQKTSGTLQDSRR